MNILGFDNGSGSKWWRLESPAMWLNKHTEHQMSTTGYKNYSARPNGAHIVVFQLFSSPRAIDEIHSVGAKAVYEADDAFIDSYGKERKELVQLNDVGKQINLDTIKKCDAMTVTNEVLKKNFARFFKGPIYVLPNYMDFNWWGNPEDNKPTRNSDEIRLGWAGSRSHHEDLRQIIVPALLKILPKYKNVKFVYCGYGGMSSDKMVTEIGWGEDSFKEIPRDRREYVVSVPTDIWPTKSRTLDFDIGMAPLIEDYFNENKTNIKWQEYSANKVPGVYSPTVYNEVVNHGKNGFIAKTVNEWVKYLSMLIEDEQLRRKVGEQAYQDVKNNWSMENHYKEWEEVYKQVLVS